MPGSVWGRCITCNKPFPSLIQRGQCLECQRVGSSAPDDLRKHPSLAQVEKELDNWQRIWDEWGA